MQEQYLSGNAFIERLIMEPKTQNVWTLNHSVWFTFMGVAGALFLNRVFFGIELGAVLGLPLADVLSIVLISIGGLILIADLGRPLRLLRVFLHVRHSWISIGAFADFVFLIFEGLFILPELQIAGSQPFAFLPFGPGTPLGFVFQAIAAFAALVVIVYPGFVMSSSTSIPFWNTSMIPMHFLTFGFAGAAGIVFLVGGMASTVEIETATTIALITAVATLILVVSHFFEGYYRRNSARSSALDLVKRGTLPYLFVGGVLLLGLVLPLILLVSASASGVVLIIAALLLLIGNWLSKYTILKVGKYESVF